MTSLMDIVSIIVVYLLKSYASDPVVINPTAGQKIPLSTADAPMQDGIPIFVTLRGITFDDKKVVSMTPEGDIDPTVTNHLIGPLYDALAEEVDKAKTLGREHRQALGWPRDPRRRPGPQVQRPRRCHVHRRSRRVHRLLVLHHPQGLNQRIPTVRGSGSFPRARSHFAALISIGVSLRPSGSAQKSANWRPGPKSTITAESRVRWPPPSSRSCASPPSRTTSSAMSCIRVRRHR
jgi:hypothetical protein